MKRRIFIAINLPEKLKKRLKEYREEFDYLPVRWTKEDSLHLTLVFIGYVTDEQMLETCRVAKEIARNEEPLAINFKRIILGPPGKTPRMIWLEGEPNEALRELKEKLEAQLLKNDSGLQKAEARSFSPHITLARIKSGQWREYDIPKDIEREFSAEVPAASIEIMESDLKRDGAEYAVLESCPLG